ncbi:bifunctional riboflavin kinase/FAD synthetase [Corynebacterium anserum]|uniref:Riboflavin biosynthesis protein n=1 Tax=Corynebacterium anserum TaxID=2684406 RepID=A0A7G7YNS5_9CORY|nr:bifunctional riboflavin kinase/FAD synthetase [Corynebacterium anserum]QNH96145.1 bifunctional riboflavin kinase/FAD synthetase [Corynebacterium anserum]
MSIWYGLDRIPEELSAQGSVVTIGVFDGVHRGHQQLINAAVEKAKELDIPSVMFTFDPHPTVIFRPDRVPALLGTVEDRARLALGLGIDHVVVVGFTSEIARWSPEEYVDNVLVDLLGARAVIVGENFTFGHQASGKPDTLRQLGRERDMEVTVIPLLNDDGHTISSTYIRERLEGGDVAAAREALGRPFSVRGEVTHGAGRGGRALGFPTANLYFQDKFALPSDGVYAGYLTVDSESQGNPTLDGAQTVGTMPVGCALPAAISVGTNPTFGHEPRSVESFVLDHDADLYGLNVTVQFLHRLRGMETYTSLEELIDAINEDVARTRQMLEKP